MEALTQGICDLALNFAEDGDEKKMSRPFGVALLLAGYDDKGPQLFFSDPSGTYAQFKAKVGREEDRWWARKGLLASGPGPCLDWDGRAWAVLQV